MYMFTYYFAFTNIALKKSWLKKGRLSTDWMLIGARYCPRIILRAGEMIQ